MDVVGGSAAKPPSCQSKPTAPKRVAAPRPASQEWASFAALPAAYRWATLMRAEVSSPTAARCADAARPRRRVIKWNAASSSRCSATRRSRDLWQHVHSNRRWRWSSSSAPYRLRGELRTVCAHGARLPAAPVRQNKAALQIEKFATSKFVMRRSVVRLKVAKPPKRVVWLAKIYAATRSHRLGAM